MKHDTRKTQIFKNVIHLHSNIQNAALAFKTLLCKCLLLYFANHRQVLLKQFTCIYIICIKLYRKTENAAVPKFIKPVPAMSIRRHIIFEGIDVFYFIYCFRASGKHKLRPANGNNCEFHPIHFRNIFFNSKLHQLKQLVVSRDLMKMQS